MPVLQNISPIPFTNRMKHPHYSTISISYRATTLICNNWTSAMTLFTMSFIRLMVQVQIMFHHFSLKKSAASFAAPVRFILIRSLLEAQKLASIMLELQVRLLYCFFFNLMSLWRTRVIIHIFGSCIIIV